LVSCSDFVVLSYIVQIIHLNAMFFIVYLQVSNSARTSKRLAK